jgi:hypothetical protein
VAVGVGDAMRRRSLLGLLAGAAVTPLMPTAPAPSVTDIRWVHRGKMQWMVPEPPVTGIRRLILFDHQGSIVGTAPFEPAPDGSLRAVIRNGRPCHVVRYTITREDGTGESVEWDRVLGAGDVVQAGLPGAEGDEEPSRYDDPNADLPDPDDPDYDPLRDDSEEGEEKEEVS